MVCFLVPCGLEFLWPVLGDGISPEFLEGEPPRSRRRRFLWLGHPRYVNSQDLFGVIITIGSENFLSDSYPVMTNHFGKYNRHFIISSTHFGDSQIIRPKEINHLVDEDE